MKRSIQAKRRPWLSSCFPRPPQNSCGRCGGFMVEGIISCILLLSIFAIIVPTLRLSLQQSQAADDQALMIIELRNIAARLQANPALRTTKSPEELFSSEFRDRYPLCTLEVAPCVARVSGTDDTPDTQDFQRFLETNLWQITIRRAEEGSTVIAQYDLVTLLPPKNEPSGDIGTSAAADASVRGDADDEVPQ